MAKELYGINAEIEAKRLAKYDKNEEMKAMKWISEMIHEDIPEDFWFALKSGVVLCKLLNSLKPGMIKFNPNPKFWIDERENINKYINACAVYGVPPQDLFSELDLSENNKFMTPVLNNIFAVARQAQAHGWGGPQLGVRYYKSVEDQQREREKKAREREEEEERKRVYDAERAQRRDQIDEERKKIGEAKGRYVETRGERRRKRREKRGKVLAAFAENIVFKEGQDKVLFGMDYEKEKKNLMSYDIEMEDNIMDWIEELVGEEIDYFYECLKSGRILCKMLNAIKPGTVPHINPPGNHLVERENIKYFLRACQVFGVSSYDIFDIQDLYTNANPKAVMRTLMSLSRGLSNLSWYKGPLCVITKVNNRRMTHEESMRNVVSVSDVLGTIEEKNEQRGSSDVETDYSEEDEPSESSRVLRGQEQEPFLTRLSTDNFNEDQSEDHKVRRSSLTSSLVAKGPKALFLYALVLFLCGSGHFTEIWIRDFAYLGSCSNTSSPCIRDELLEIGYIVYFVGFMISGVVYFLLGPKFTSSVGLLMKALGSIFLSGDFGYSDTFLYLGYYCFTLGGPLLLTSTTHAYYKYFKKNPHFKISLLLCFVASYLNGGHWIFFVLSQVKDQVPIHIFFNIYAGILILLSLVTFASWPTYAQIRIYSLQKQKNVFGSTSCGKFFRSFNLNFAFLCVFFPLAYLPWRLYLDDLFDPSADSFLSPAYAIAVILSVGSISSILLPQLTRFFSYNTYINYTLLSVWIIPETALHVAPSQITYWIRAFTLGVCLPYLFGFLFHFLLEREGPFFGLKLSIVSALCGCLEVAAYFLRPSSYFNEKVRWYLHLVMAGLFGFFFILPLACWTRNRIQYL